MDILDDLDRAVVARIPVVVKSYHQSGSGRRIVEVEASNQSVDYDGDIVLQSALLDSAESFIATGHLDIDHLSELGGRLNPPIKDPLSYIVGRPLSVRKGVGDSTIVEGEISRSIDGRDDPTVNRYDEFWASLRREPPVVWFSSIYGFPTDIDDCTGKACASGATRFVIKAINWRSLAFTRVPKNSALKMATRIVTAKSYLTELAKSAYVGAAPMAVPPSVALPQSIGDAAAPCPHCGFHEAPSLIGLRKHFGTCKGYEPGTADILAHAVMHRTNMDRALPLTVPNLAPTSGL